MRSILRKQISSHCLKGKHSSAKGEALEFSSPSTPKTPCKGNIHRLLESQASRLSPALAQDHSQLVPFSSSYPFYPLPFTLFFSLFHPYRLQVICRSAGITKTVCVLCVLCGEKMKALWDIVGVTHELSDGLPTQKLIAPNMLRCSQTHHQRE